MNPVSKYLSQTDSFVTIVSYYSALQVATNSFIREALQGLVCYIDNKILLRFEKLISALILEYCRCILKV